MKLHTIDKPINLTKALRAHRVLQDARDRYEFAQSTGIGLATAKSAYEKAQEEYGPATDYVKDVFDKAQKGCTSRTNEHYTVYHAIDDVEKGLKVAKCKLDGVRADIDTNAQDFARAYKYIPESTHILIENRKGHWYLLNVSREKCRARGHEVELSLTEAVKQALISRFENGQF